MQKIGQRQRYLERLTELHERYNGSECSSEEYSGYAKATTPFRPYNDYYVNLEDNPYEGDGDTINDFDDSTINKFINNLLANQALSLASNRDYHEEFDGSSAFAQEKIPDMCKVRPNKNTLYNDRLPRKKTRNVRQGRSRRSKVEQDRPEVTYSDIPAGGELSMTDGTVMITLPLDMLRQYMYSEVEARVWNVNAYYQHEWEMINKERLTTLAELVHVQESSRKIKRELEQMKETLKKYKDMCDNLGSKVENTKEAKRRKRQAKKQRKTEQLAGSLSQVGSGMEDNDLDNVLDTRSHDDVVNID